jgi:hypothetical protein
MSTWSPLLRSGRQFFLVLCSLIICAGCGGGGGGSNGGGNGGGGGSAQNPVPTVRSLSPNSATVGGAGMTMTVSGDGFIAASVVEWNGTALTTTYVSSSSLTAPVPGSNIANPGTANVVVRNPSPGGGSSSPQTFTINPLTTKLGVVDVEGSDLAWNTSQQRIYVAVPGGASTNPKTITIVDPIQGAVVGTQSLSSTASGLAVSDDNQYLYAVTGGGATIQRFSLPTLTPGIQWSLGTDSFSGAANLAGDIKVQPGSAHTLAVSYGQYGSGSIAVFDDAVSRASVATSFNLGNSLQWKPDGTALYAAYTIGNDSGFYTAVSDDALYTMPVTSNGVGAITTHHSSFRQESAHLHLDAATALVVGDWGETINPTNGIPAGNYAWKRPASTTVLGPLSVADSNLHRFYILLEIQGPGGAPAFQLQSFDESNFRLIGTLVIPNTVGHPVNLIRWGQAGLAFVTNSGSGSAAGKLFIVDGTFVNPSAEDGIAGAQVDPVPTLTAISPMTATVGSSALTLTITGRDFASQPTVYWNGTALQTTLVDSTHISTQVPASLLSSPGEATITVSNSGSSFPTSDVSTFAINSAPPSGNQISVYDAGGNDLVWDAVKAKLYVSVPGVQGDTGNTIAIIDPVAGTVTNSNFLGSEPARLSLSSDGNYVFVALYGQNSVEQLNVPGMTVNAAWNLGGEGSFDGPYYALDLQAAPGDPQTTAVTLANYDVSPSSAGVAIYDGSTLRANILPSGPYEYSGLQWADDSTLYAVDQSVPQSFLVLGVGPAGAVLNQHYDGAVTSYASGMHYDTSTGLIYTNSGLAIQPSNGSVVGDYAASGLLVADATLNRVYILGQTAAQNGTADYTIESFDKGAYTPVGSITVENVVGTPTGFVRWGSDGLAFTTRVGQPSDFTRVGPGQLYVISGSFVTSARNGVHATSEFAPVARTWNVSTKPGSARSQ